MWFLKWSRGTFISRYRIGVSFEVISRNIHQSIYFQCFKNNEITFSWIRACFYSLYHWTICCKSAGWLVFLLELCRPTWHHCGGTPDPRPHTPPYRFGPFRLRPVRWSRRDGARDRVAFTLTKRARCSFFLNLLNLWGQFCLSAIEIYILTLFLETLFA